MHSINSLQLLLFATIIDDGVVVKASTLRLFHFTCLVIPNNFKNEMWYPQFSCLALSTKGVVFGTSQQVLMLCSWARQLMVCLHPYVEGRWWGQAVY